MVSKSEYDKVLKANSELRMKLEKMRLENVLLKDQMRVIAKLPAGEAAVYITVQREKNISIEEMLAMREFSGKERSDIINVLNVLLERGLIDVGEKNGREFFYVKTQDLAGSLPKAKKIPVVGEIIRVEKKKTQNEKDSDDVSNILNNLKK